MKALVTYIFHNRRYNEIIKTYQDILSNYSEAYNVWKTVKLDSSLSGFALKEFVANQFSAIKEVNRWIRLANRIKSTQRIALEMFYYESGLTNIPPFNYQTYKEIADNEKHINDLYRDYSKCLDLERNYKEAVSRYLAKFQSAHRFENILRVAKGEKEIRKIDEILEKCHNYERKYPSAWSIIAKGKDFTSIPLNELTKICNDISDESLSIKETFCIKQKENANLISLIIGTKHHHIESFDLEIISVEKLALQRINVEMQYPEVPEVICKIEDITEKKQAILGCTRYGKDVNFVDSFTIPSFYELRKESDKLDLSFEEIVKIVKGNYDAIKQYNLEKSGKETVYIEDYIPAATKGSELSNYIEKFNRIKEIRNQAKLIANNNPLGFKILYGDINFNTCDLSLANAIIDNKSRIEDKEQEERQKEFIRKEAERKRQEEERKKQEKAHLLSRVADWYTHTWNGSVKHKWYCDYYSYHDHKDYATSNMWVSWRFIWSFKNDPAKNISEHEHNLALDKAINWVETVLKETFGYDVNKLTLVCLTASTRLKNDRRFKSFAERVCNDLNMYNAYNHINIVSDGEAKHEGGTVTVDKSYDTCWFKDKYIVLFDDVRTSGRGIEKEKRILESLGATVICAITLGQTTHM